MNKYMLLRKIDKQNRITLPKSIVEYLNISKNDKLVISLVDDNILIKKYIENYSLIKQILNIAEIFSQTTNNKYIIKYDNKIIFKNTEINNVCSNNMTIYKDDVKINICEFKQQKSDIDTINILIKLLLSI